MVSIDISITPLFLGEVVRTYSWIIVLGSTGFINSLLMGVGLIERPLRLMFTQLGVVIALVHVTLPIMVLMLAAGLSHDLLRLDVQCVCYASVDRRRPSEYHFDAGVSVGLFVSQFSIRGQPEHSRSSAYRYRLMASQASN